MGSRRRAKSYHPAVGDLTLTLEASTSVLTPALRISACTPSLRLRAEPGTRSDDALKLLATWAAILDQAVAAPAPDGS